MTMITDAVHVGWRGTSKPGGAMGAQKRTTREITHSSDLPAVCQAAQIALLIMKKLKVSTWKDMVDKAAETDLREHVILTRDQQALIDEYAHVVPYLRAKPVTTIIACTGCGLYGIAGPASVGKRCPFRLHCEGQVVKAPATAPRRPK